MTIGSFRLNTISAVAASGGSSEAFWILQYNGSGSDTYQYIDQVAVDSSGNVYFVVGSTSPTLIGTTRDGILVKVNSSGTVQATTRFNISTNEIPYGVAISGSNIFVSSVNGTATQIHQFDTSLNRIQTDRILNTGSAIRGIGVDGTGNFYFGYDNASTNISTRVAFISGAAASASGPTWTKQLSNTTYNNETIWHTTYDPINPQVIALFSVNNVLHYTTWGSAGAQFAIKSITGTGAPIGQNRTHARPGNNAYIVGDDGASNTSVTKIDASNLFSWAKTVSGQVSRGSAVDSAYNIYVATNDGTPATSYVSKFNSSGTLQWQRSISVTGGTSSGSSIMGITCTDTAIYLEWYLFTSGGDDVPFIIKLPADGSKTGTYTNGSYSITWTTSSLTWSSATFTLTNATPATVTSPTVTWTAPGMSTTTSGLTATLTSVP